MTKREQRRQDYENQIFENWQIKRDEGKWHFILRFGLLTWGASTFALYWVIMMILGKIGGLGNLFTWFQAIYSFVFFILFGILYGLVLWNRNEKIFKKKYPYGRIK
ncbi:MAG: hypothetical protein IBX70_07560 [Clostridia bacterium]|nr:hypothetical protein [Clostridia bacterium]